MANTKVRGITIELGADTSGIQQALKNVNQSISQTSRELKDIDRLLKLDPTNTELLAQKQDALQKIIGETRSKMDTLTQAMKDLNAEMVDGGTEEQQRQMAALQREYVSCEQSLKKYEGQLEDTDKDLGTVTKDTKAAEKSTKDYGETVQKVAKIAAEVFAAVVAAAGALATAMAGCIKETMEYGDEVDKLSQKVGLSYDAYQRWDYALKISGTEMSAMRTGLKTLTNTFDDAKNGTQSAIDKFERLGLSMEDIQDLSREELFKETIKALQRVEDGTEKAAIANDLFARSGQDLIPLLNMSAEETDRLLEKAGELGGVLEDETIRASADLKDSLTSLQTAFKGITRSISGSVMQPVRKAIDGITKVLTGKTKEGLEEVKAGIDEFVEELGKGKMMKKITDTISGMLQVFNEVIKGFIKAIPTLLKEIPALVKDVLLSVVSLIKEIDWLGLIKGIGEAILGVIGSIGEVIFRVIFPAADAWYAHRDAMNELYEAGEEIYEQAQRLGEQRQDTYASLEAEAEILTDIREKLIEYTDEQGHVKEGYEDEMDALILLAESQGIHIEKLGDEIVAMDETIQTIDELIAKRKLDAVTAAETDLYEQAYKERRKLEGDYKTHYNNFLKALEQSDKAYSERRLDEAKKYKDTAELELAAAESLKDGIVEYTAQMDLATYNMEQAATGNLDALATTFEDAGIDVQNYYDGIKETNGKIIKNYEQTYSVDIPKAIEDGEYEQHKAITDMIDTANAYGSDISQQLGWGINDGFVKGLRDTRWKVEQEARGMMNSVITQAKLEAGIKSPSRVFREIGENITKGLTLGIDDGAQSAIDATVAMMNGITQAGAGVSVGMPNSGVLGGFSGNSITMNVYGAEGQDINTLADSVMDRIQYSLGRSGAIYA